jgi:hypothetical protein
LKTLKNGDQKDDEAENERILFFKTPSYMKFNKQSLFNPPFCAPLNIGLQYSFTLLLKKFKINREKFIFFYENPFLCV